MFVVAASIVGGGLALLILWLLLTKKRPSDAPPNASIGIPVVGNFLEFAKNPVAFIETCVKKYGQTFTVPMLHKNLTFVVGPEVSTPFFKLSDDFMSQNEVYSFMTPVFGKNVVYDAEPKKRTQQYQSMANGLRGNRLRSYVPKIERETLDYVSKWGDSGVVNILEALSELTILTSSRCLHGDDVREKLFADVSRLYHDLDQGIVLTEVKLVDPTSAGITPISFFFPYAPIAAHRKRDHARKEMVQIFSKIMAARRSEAKDVTENRTDILQIFIEMVYKDDGSKLSDDEVVGLLIALLFAGQHTSSITSTWSLMLLLHHPKELEKVLLEQKQVLGDKVLDYDIVGNMECLQNAVKESLRLFPPLIMLMRMAMQDIPTTLNGVPFIIPKGDIVVASPAVSSRLQSVFKNPNNFEPDRFGPERNEQATPYAYLGFGAGMHQCMGQQFGLLQVKTILSTLLREFKFEAVDDVIPEPDYTAMVVGPKNHVHVRYTRIRK